MAKPEPMRIIGKSVPIMEARDKAVGAFTYPGDVKSDLQAKFLRSPHPHARIKRIDTSKAEKLQGVEAIITYRDVPARQMRSTGGRGSYVLDDRVRYVGDEVAAVAATSEAVAEEALGLIEVDYEVLPAVFDPEEAAKPDAPKLYPEGNVYGPDVTYYVTKGTNAPMLYSWGDVNEGFKQADVVVQDSFELKPQIHSPIEPRTCTALWNGEELTVWNCTHTPWMLREDLSHVFEIPESRIRVLSQLGGGFGGKYTEKFQHLVVLLAMKTRGQSVKLTFTREEEQCQTKRANCKIHGRLGLRKDGTITALELRLYFDLGAYGNAIGGSCGLCEEAGMIAYRLQNARWEVWDVHTNHFMSQCCRSVHVPALSFSTEQLIDEAAEKLGLDPVEVRLKNVPDTGDEMPPQPWVHNARGYSREKLDLYPAREMIKTVAKKIGWDRWRGWGKPLGVNGPKRRGISLVCSGGYAGYNTDGFTSQQVCINCDGSAIVHSGAQDLGTGVNTALRMIAAEALGLALEDVAIMTADTATGQYDLRNARSSHELTMGGHILLLAIEDVKQKLRERLAPLFNARPEDIEVSGKKAYVRGSPEKARPMRDLITSPVMGHGTGPTGSRYPPVRPGYKPRQPMVQAAEVEVDIETGEVKPVRMVVACFPGRMINPRVVRGQGLGGAVMTLGMGLYEECKFDGENLTYSSKDFTDYRIPRALDIPDIETVLLEEVDVRPPHEGLPYGARAVGEMTAWGGPAVYATAVYNATGVRIRTSPVTPERVLPALEDKESAK